MTEHPGPLPVEHTPPWLARLGRVSGPLACVLCLVLAAEPLGAVQARVAGVTAWTAIWWITAALPLGITALLPAVLFPVLGVMGAKQVAPLYMQDLVMLFLGAFVVSQGLERWDVHRRIALWIVARVGTGPRRLVLGFMVASAFLSLWINNTSTTLLMLPIAMAVVASVPECADAPHAPGASMRGPFATALLLGIAYSASVGGIGTPVGTAPNQVFLGILRTMFPGGPELSFGEWILAWLPLVALFLPCGWLLLTRVALRVPALAVGPKGSSPADAIRAERASLGRMSRTEKRMAAVFVTTALLWVTRAELRLGSFRLPGWVDLVVRVEDASRFVTDATVALAMAVVCFVLPSGAPGGGALMDWQHARRLPWDVLLLIGGGFALAGGFQASGLDETLGTLLARLLVGHGPLWIVLVVVLFMTTLTEITSNTATTAVLVPILGRAAVDAGLNPLVTMAPAAVAASAAFMLPVATPPNAVVFASGRVPAPTMARVGLWVNLLMIVLVSLVFHFWASRVLGIEAGLPDWAAAGAQGSR